MFVLPKIYDIVRSYDLDPISSPNNSGENFKFRVEILKERGRKNLYHVRIFRHETFRILPTFPQKGGKPRYEAADHECLIKDDMIDYAAIREKSAKAALSEALRRIKAIFSAASRNSA